MTQRGEDWAERLVKDVIAGQIKHYRQQRKMSAQQLADRCAELGFPIARNVLANLESRRRTTFNVAELLVIAQALAVSPVLLVTPIGRQETMEVIPGFDVNTWDAAEWFRGEADDPIPTIDPESHRTYRLPILLFRDHAALLRNLWQGRATVKRLVVRVEAGENGDTAATLEAARETLKATEQAIRTLRGSMRGSGLTPPKLGNKDAYLQDDMVLVPDYATLEPKPYSVTDEPIKGSRGKGKP